MLARKKSVFKYRIQSPESIFPPDFLSFCVGAAVIGDPNLEDSDAHPRCFCGQFRFDSESVFFDLYLGNHFAAKDFIATLHIGKIDVGEHVAEHGEKAITDHVPVEDYAVGTDSRKARAKYDVGFTLKNGPDESRELLWVVFQVRILDGHNIASGLPETSP